MSRYLTKSRFKLATECPTKLFYSDKPNEYRNNTQEDSFLEMLAEGGYQVGELAKLRYPEGIEIKEKKHDEAHAITQAHLRQENVVLFEPAILINHFFIRIDLLVKKGNKFELIEVKAKSYDSQNPTIAGKRKSISSEYLSYIEDVAFQKWVLQEAFPHAEISTFLMMPDKSKVAETNGINQIFKVTGQGDVVTRVPAGVDIQYISENLLAKVCIDQFVGEVLFTPLSYPGGQAQLVDLAEEWAEAYLKDNKITPVIGMQCGSCQFKAAQNDVLKSGFHECWKANNHWEDADFEDGTVLDLWNFKRKQQLIDQGIYKLSQIDRHDIGDFEDEADETGLTRMQRQWLQVNGIPASYDCGGYYFDKAYFQMKISKWRYPFHMIDFETATVALPFYSGMKPYEALAFQFSHHVIESNGKVHHMDEFLCTEPGEFPNYKFARALKAVLEKDDGTVFMWSSHENTILEAIIRQLSSDQTPPEDADELIDFMKTLVKGGDRAMVDLCKVAEKSYFHPDTKGSNSIKQVLPTMLKESHFLKETYSESIYGAPGRIMSLNFNSDDGFSWVESDSSGMTIDPYAKLKQYALDLLPDGLISTEDEASVIAEGGAATTAYARLQFEDLSKSNRQKINKALLRYCELDTFAMVMIMQGWMAEFN